MRKLRNLIGMNVICGRKRIGRVIRADLSDDLTQMDGIWIDCGLRGTRYISSDRLSMIGNVAVMADGRGQRKRMKESALLYRAIATDGRRLGAITGAAVDELTFMVIFLELTHGYWDDLMSGRSSVYAYSVSPERREVIVIDSIQLSEREE